MSGPKISLYSLAPQQREYVLGQFRCEQEAVACAKQIAEFLRECAGRCPELEQALEQLRIYHNRTGKAGDELAALEQFCGYAAEQLEQLTATLHDNMPRVAMKYVATEEAFERSKAMLYATKNLRDSVKTLLKDIGKTAYSALATQEETTEEIRQSIAADLSGILLWDESENAADDSFETHRSEIEQQLAAIAAQPLSSELAHQVQTARNALAKITEESYLTTFYSVTVKKLLRQAAVYQAKREAERLAFEELVARYKLLCELCEVEPSQAICTQQTMAGLQTEIESMEQMLYRRYEQAYIYDCVEEVMEEMGYTLIGSREVKKKSGKQFKNELYTFREGTGVNITYAPDGQIAMELGGLAREDRLPTEEEAEALTEDMTAFCGEFAEFERRLRAKGVQLGTRVALAPPSAEYAAILNLNDYQIEADVQVQEMKTGAKKKTTAETKQMRREL